MGRPTRQPPNKSESHGRLGERGTGDSIEEAASIAQGQTVSAPMRVGSLPCDAPFFFAVLIGFDGTAVICFAPDQIWDAMPGLDSTAENNTKKIGSDSRCSFHFSILFWIFQTQIRRTDRKLA
jgi:hypothetical protein